MSNEDVCTRDGPPEWMEVLERAAAWHHGRDRYGDLIHEPAPLRVLSATCDVRNHGQCTGLMGNGSATRRCSCRCHGEGWAA